MALKELDTERKGYDPAACSFSQVRENRESGL